MKYKGRVIYPELSYIITGLFFKTQNALGRYSREKQYCDYFERLLQQERIEYKREIVIGDSGNRLDFLIEDKIVVECKAKGNVTKDDYFQVQRYLQSAGKSLGLLINFRDRYLKPKRIVRIQTEQKNKYL